MAQYFRTDPDLDRDVSVADFNEIFNPNAAFITLFNRALEYQGFDPKIVLKQMCHNAAAYRDANPGVQAWDMSNVNNDFVTTATTVAGNRFTNAEKLPRDVSVLVLMFLTRNSHISKIIKKSRSEIADILEMLKEKYDINDETRSSGTQIGATDVTLPRIAAIFPATAARYFHMKVVKEIVPFATIPSSAAGLSHALTVYNTDLRRRKSLNRTVTIGNSIVIHSDSLQCLY